MPHGYLEKEYYMQRKEQTKGLVAEMCLEQSQNGIKKLWGFEWEEMRLSCGD